MASAPASTTACAAPVGRDTTLVSTVTAQSAAAHVAGSDLVDASQMVHRGHRRRRAHRDAWHLDAGGPQALGAAHHHVALLTSDGWTVAPVGVAGMGEQAAEEQPRRRGDAPRQVDDRRSLRIDARPMVAAVDLEQHAQRPGGGGESRQRFAGVDHQPEIDPPGQLDGLRQPSGYQRKGPGQVVESVLGQDPRLVESRHGEAASAELGLPTGDLDTLVGLDMWSQGDAQAAGPIRHASQVGLQPVEIEQQGRRRQVVEARRHAPSLACPSHRTSTAMPYLPTSAALCSVGHPRRTARSPAVTSVAKPSISRQLRHFATRRVRRAG
jgi:hypothetical protein